jgi:hypothetical protein
MSAIIKSETISRRKALSLMGLAAAFGLAAAPTVLTASDAEAQTPAAPTAAAPTAVAPTAGMQRRAARHERRMQRRAARHERRQERRTGTATGTGTTTGAATTTGTGTGEKK